MSTPVKGGLADGDRYLLRNPGSALVDGQKIEWIEVRHAHGHRVGAGR